jgi:DNA gyrase subunit A
VRRSGIIAMKLDDGEAIVDVQICTPQDDVLLTAAGGQCIRFAVDDVRVFQGRTSMGVRGITLGKGDQVISLSILRHVDATPAERAAYLKQSGAIRRAATGEDTEPEEPTVEAEDAAEADFALPQERYVEMGAAEQFVLTVTELGYGKRSSSYEFRVSGRGGKGIRATDLAKLQEIGSLVAAFPVETSDQIMLVSNGGQLIRVPVDGIRMTSRASKGVRVFSTAEGERVVSVERLSEESEENGG